MLSEHERYYGLVTDALGTDALVNRVLSKTDVINMVQCLCCRRGLNLIQQQTDGTTCQHGVRLAKQTDRTTYQNGAKLSWRLLVYGLDALTLQQKHLKRIDAFYIRFLRRIIGIKLRHHTSPAFLT